MTIKKYSLPFFLLVVVTLASLPAMGASGVYLTYDDFKNGSLTKADEGTLAFHIYAHTLTMKANGEKKKFEGKKIWGFLLDDELFRIIMSPQNIPLPCELNDGGKYCTWNYTESYFATNSQTGAVGSKSMEINYLSYGLNGEAFIMWRVKQLEKAVSKESRLKPVLDCVKADKDMESAVGTISDCLKQLPGYIDARKIVPPIKN